MRRERINPLVTFIILVIVWFRSVNYPSEQQGTETKSVTPSPNPPQTTNGSGSNGGPTPITPAPPPPTADPDENNRFWTLKRVRLALTLASLAALGASIFWSSVLTSQPDDSALRGTVHLLIPFDRPNYDQFTLQVALDDPESTSVQYTIQANCGNRSKYVLLMLSGDARLTPPGHIVPEEHVTVSGPWFTTPQKVQVFRIPIQEEPCPHGIPTGPGGGEAVIAGTVYQSFEDSSGSSHTLQLPQVGDGIGAGNHIPKAGRTFWAQPATLTVSVNAGSLPLKDRIDAVRPDLTGSGDLSWTNDFLVRPSVSWTDTNSASQSQFFLVLIGAIIGITVSILATVVLDLTRKPSA